MKAHEYGTIAGDVFAAAARLNETLREADAAGLSATIDIDTRAGSPVMVLANVSMPFVAAQPKENDRG